MRAMRSTAERVKPARGNRTSKGAEKWLDVQEHFGTEAAVAHLRAAGCPPSLLLHHPCLLTGQQCRSLCDAA